MRANVCFAVADAVIQPLNPAEVFIQTPLVISELELQRIVQLLIGKKERWRWLHHCQTNATDLIGIDGVCQDSQDTLLNKHQVRLRVRCAVIHLKDLTPR